MAATKRTAADTPIRDPGMVYGDRYRPLTRADGKAFVYDPELPFGKRTVGGKLFRQFADADAYAQELARALVKP